jgi:hypothetical protein
MTASYQIALRHFGRKADASLARKGIRVLGLQAIPVNGSYLLTETGYVVDDNGTGRIWSYREVAGRA